MASNVIDFVLWKRLKAGWKLNDCGVWSREWTQHESYLYEKFKILPCDYKLIKQNKRRKQS